MEDILKLAERIANREQIFHLLNPLNGEFDFYKWYKRTTQEMYARCAITDMVGTVELMFASLPMGKELSDDIEDFFKPMHMFFGPTTAYPLLIGRIPDIAWDQDEVLSGLGKEIRTIKRYMHIVEAYFGYKKAKMVTATNADEEKAFYNYQRPPKSMSEVIAALITAMNWDPEQDIDKIDKIVANWIPSGSQKYRWKNQDVEFDYGMSKEAIINAMQEMKAENYYESI